MNDSMDHHYLEFSDPQGSEHKFYEVLIEDATLTVRYGRIGTEGQAQVKTLASNEAARAEAEKKLREKRRKGYADAVKGERQKRAPVRRNVQEVQTSSARRAPLLWRFQSGTTAYGIFVGGGRCWVGNEGGEVYALSPAGEPELKFQLPDGVKCLVSDGRFLFAGCDDGQVYDLSGKLPFVAYTVDPGMSLLWLDIQGGLLGVADEGGSVYAFDAESDQQWGNVGQGASMGWMVRVDTQGVYYGHSRGVGMYDRTSGLPVWERSTHGAVLFGWQDGPSLYAGTTARLVQRFSKSGEHLQDYQCDASIMSCATSPAGYVFAADNASAIYCFAEGGERLWKLASGCGSALSMQYADERLYVVTTHGVLAAIDASEAAIQAAQQGVTPTVRDVKLATALEARTPQTALATTNDVGSGVLLECSSEGGKLRVRPISPGYHAHWRVQFPRNLREAGARYVVDSLTEVNGFYRVGGEIRRVQSGA